MGKITPNFRPLRVLVVEDYQYARESLRLLISAWGHNCETATTGQAALEIASAFQPDIVLMDLTLPSMEGSEVACAIGELPGLSGVVFVAMLGYGRAEDEPPSRDVVPFTHMVSAADPEELREVLDFFATPDADPAALVGSVPEVRIEW